MQFSFGGKGTAQPYRSLQCSAHGGVGPQGHRGCRFTWKCVRCDTVSDRQIPYVQFDNPLIYGQEFVRK